MSVGDLEGVAVGIKVDSFKGVAVGISVEGVTIGTSVGSLEG